MRRPLEPPIIQFWHESARPEFVDELLASVAEHNPGREHLVFDTAAAEALIASHYGEREVSAFRSCALPAMQADYFRYCAVHALGGVYLDADCRCLGSLGQLVDRPGAGVLFGRDSLVEGMVDLLGWPRPVGRFQTVVNGLFGFGEPGHPLLGLALELATANVEGRLGEGPTGVWLSVGPGVFTALYLLRELGSTDAFSAFASDSVLGPSVPTLCDLVDDERRIARAFEGVEIRPVGEAGELVAETWPPTSHREAHWAATAGQLYR